jgi:hypothetical protein
LGIYIHHGDKPMTLFKAIAIICVIAGIYTLYWQNFDSVLLFLNSMV